MEIRLIAPEDLPEYKHIRSRAFMRGAPVDLEPDELQTPLRTRLGAYENGRLQAQYSILDFELFFGQDRRPCGGIASVACEPSARGRGYAGALIDRSLEIMRERGQFLSLLWPFDQRFYRRYGWDWTGHDRSYTVPLSLLESSPDAERIEPVLSGAYEVLNPAYEAQAARYNGPFVRSRERWEHLLKPRDNRSAASYVYRGETGAEGYAVIRYEEKRDRARATEFAALTPNAYRALLTLFKRHASTVEKFSWSAPMDDILWSLINHWHIKTRISPSAMGRIVDVRAALQALKPADDLAGAAVIRIADAHAPWNKGTWRIQAEGGRVSVTEADSLPELQTDIQALAQAYWGTPSLLNLRRAGRLDVESEDAFSFLARLLPPAPVWLADDF